MSEGMTSGDYLKALEATRDAIVADLDECESMRDRAALYNRLESVLGSIKDARPKEVASDAVDEITRRRAARRASPAARASRAKQSG